jgi:hypothetical protein
MWAEAFGDFGRATGKEIATDELEVGKKHPDLRIGEDEREYSVQAPAAQLHTQPNRK